MIEMRPSIYTYFGILSLISMDIGRWIYSGSNRDLNPGPNEKGTQVQLPNHCTTEASVLLSHFNPYNFSYRVNVTLYWFLFFINHFNFVVTSLYFSFSLASRWLRLTNTLFCSESNGHTGPRTHHWTYCMTVILRTLYTSTFIDSSGIACPVHFLCA